MFECCNYVIAELIILADQSIRQLLRVIIILIAAPRLVILTNWDDRRNDFNRIRIVLKYENKCHEKNETCDNSRRENRMLMLYVIPHHIRVELIYNCLRLIHYKDP